MLILSVLKLINLIQQLKPNNNLSSLLKKKLLKKKLPNKSFSRKIIQLNIKMDKISKLSRNLCINYVMIRLIIKATVSEI